MGAITPVRANADCYSNKPVRLTQVDSSFRTDGAASTLERLVLIAVSRGRAVGVDIEKVRGDMDGVAARFFHKWSIEGWSRSSVRADTRPSSHAGHARRLI
jgi:hypothetical protein